MEMYLGKSNDDSISWIDVQRVRGGVFQLNIYSVFDDGDVDRLDVYDFSPVDPDKPFEVYEFESLDLLMNYIKVKYNFDSHRFVSEGMIQEEYRLFKLRE